jgi:hypothetical protein
MWHRWDADAVLMRATMMERRITPHTLLVSCRMDVRIFPALNIVLNHETSFVRLVKCE